MLDKIKRLYLKIASFFPTNLPVGMPEFETFASSVLDLSGRFADEDSMKYALASMILHLGPQRSRVAKNYFVQSLRKAAANQVASQVFQDIKIKQAEEQERLKQEATNKSVDSSPSDEKSDQKTVS